MCFLLVLVIQTFQNFFECAYFLPKGLYLHRFSAKSIFHSSVDLILQIWTEYHIHKETFPRSSCLFAHLFFIPSFNGNIVMWGLFQENIPLWVFLFAENRALEMSRNKWSMLFLLTSLSWMLTDEKQNFTARENNFFGR